MSATQNYSNHSQIVPPFHYGLMGTLLVVIIGSGYHTYQTFQAGSGRLQAILFLILALCLTYAALFSRLFALKAQDRAIRAEQQLRYFVASGKPMPQNLTIKQIIALRFAGDEEFLTLCERAEKENLSPKEIKTAIVNWKGDYYRV